MPGSRPMHFPLCPPIFVHSGCRNKMPQLGKLDTTPSLLTVLEAGSPTSGCQYGWVRVTDIHCILTRWKLWSHSYEALTLLMRWNPLDLGIFQRPHLLMLSPLSIRIPTQEWGGGWDTNIQIIVPTKLLRAQILHSQPLHDCIKRKSKGPIKECSS